MSERNIKLVIEYEGTRYAGWQSQAGPATIQTTIEQAIGKVTGVDVKLQAAGRTDAGVHALGQVANFHIDHKLEAERFKDAINSYLPEDIMVKSSAEVSLEFHATRDAVHRRYRYLLASEKSALYRNLRWEQPQAFSLEKLEEAAGVIKGEHDFSTFCVTSSRKEDNSCRIEFSRWAKVGELCIYEIRGNRFLHNMVRSLAGSMVNLALLKSDRNSRNLTLDDFKNMLSSQAEERAVFTAPARGLYLVSVGYREDESR